MKPSNPGEKSLLTTKKKGNVIINPKKEDLMKETKLDEKKLDAVGKEDKDIDNDGDEDDTDKYLLNRRKKIGQAMKKEDVDVNEEAYGHQSAHDHKETEAREKKVGTGKVHRAKGGSY